jgi:hypothetical protein
LPALALRSAPRLNNQRRPARAGRRTNKGNMDIETIERIERLETAFEAKANDDADAFDRLWKAINETNARINFLEFVLASVVANRLKADMPEESTKYKNDLLQNHISELNGWVLSQNIMQGNEQRQAEFVAFCEEISEKFMANVAKQESLLRNKSV